MTTTFDVVEIAALFHAIDTDLARADSVADKLARVCALAVQQVDGADWAGVSQGQQDRFVTVAALNFYSATTGAFDDVDRSTAVLLATHSAAVLKQAAETDRADNLAIALESSREIGISIGILMATYRITREEAFNILRLFSQRTHRKLADIAADVAGTGALPTCPRRGRAVDARAGRTRPAEPNRRPAR